MIANVFSNRRRLPGLVTVGISAIMAAVLMWGFYFGGFAPAREDAIVHPAWVIDRSDDRQLAGAAHNIFFGQVVEQVGREEYQGTPETQFSVEVLEVLKGDVSGTITVNQEGGTYADGATYQVAGDNFLEAGTSYFFATRESSSKGWHTVVPEFGDVNLDVEASGNKDTVLASSKAGIYRTRFTAALEDPVPFPFDKDRE